jgi:hypothetical protein
MQRRLTLFLLVSSSASASLTEKNFADFQSNPGFARDLRPVSVRAPMMARFNEERDDGGDQALINSCTDNTGDVTCLYNNGALQTCVAAHDPGNDQPGLLNCLRASCPSTTEPVIDCVADPSKSPSDESEEAAIIDPCATHTNSDGITCLRVNFQICSAINISTNEPDGDYFLSCMEESCPAVSANDIGCMAQKFLTTFS